MAVGPCANVPAMRMSLFRCRCLVASTTFGGMLVGERGTGWRAMVGQFWPRQKFFVAATPRGTGGNFPLRGKKRGRVLTGSRWNRSVAQDRSSDAAGIGLSSGSPKCWRSEEATLGERPGRQKKRRENRGTRPCWAQGRVPEAVRLGSAASYQKKRRCEFGAWEPCRTVPVGIWVGSAIARGRGFPTGSSGFVEKGENQPRNDLPVPETCPGTLRIC